MMSILNYFKEKTKSYSLKELILVEIESYLAWPFRGLPSFMGFIPRFLVYKMLFKNLKSFCLIQPNVFFNHTFRISCGSNFVVNSNTYFHGLGGIEIGNNVLIGPNVVISSGEHQYSDEKIPITLQKIIPKKIVIEDDVWIGANVVVMPGIILRKGTIVGAGSIITKSTIPYSIVVGVPAKKIKMRPGHY